jgi:hypothetical protein
LAATYPDVMGPLSRLGPVVCSRCVGMDVDRDIEGCVAKTLRHPSLAHSARMERRRGSSRRLAAPCSTPTDAWRTARFPGSVRVFEPSEADAARAQLGSRRFKIEDRGRAPRTRLARRGHRRIFPDGVDDTLAPPRPRHRTQARSAATQRPAHSPSPALSAPVRSARAPLLESVIGQRVLRCAVAGRPTRDPCRHLKRQLRSQPHSRHMPGLLQPAQVGHRPRRRFRQCKPSSKGWTPQSLGRIFSLPT